MGIVNRVNQFTGATAPQMPWLDTELDNLRSEFNGSTDDANIKANAAIAQSKILNLLTDLAARVLDTGDTMTGALLLKLATPYLRLIGTEGSAKDWRLVESAGLVLLDENTGTEATPVWTTRYKFRTPNTPTADDDVSTKKYVDDLSKSLTIGKVVKTDGDVSATATFVDVPGLSITLATGARRARITLYATVSSPGNNLANIMALQATLDGVAVDGPMTTTSEDGRQHNACFSIITDVLTAASHTFKIQIKLLSQSPILAATASFPAVFTVEELAH